MAMALEITDGTKAFCPPQWQWDNKGAPTYELNLWLVLHGSGHIHLAEGDYTLQAGDCFVLRDWLPSLAIHDPAQPLVVPYVLFEYHDVTGQSVLPREDTLPPIHRRIHNLTFFATLIDRCIRAHQENRPDEARHWLRSCLTELAYQDSIPVRTGFQREQYDAIEAICESIRRNLHKPIRVAELAAEHGYSTDHFIRLFRSYVGTTPCEFCLRAKTQAAIDLLRFSSQSVTQIARALGYGNIYAFSRQFSQRTGKAPTTFRQKL